MKSGARLHIDAVALALVAAIVLLGLIMVTSASISIASRDGGDSFSFLERQLVLCLVGTRARRHGVLHPHRIHGKDGLAAADRGRWCCCSWCWSRAWATWSMAAGAGFACWASISRPPSWRACSR